MLLSGVTLGDHVCWAVDDDAVRMETIAGFVYAGLRARHKVIYNGDAPDRVLAGLPRGRAGVAAALTSGQLSATTAEDSYLAGGRFDPVATIALWRTEIAAAQAEGYLGLRVLGDMTWASRPVPGATSLAWYETQINTVFLDGYVAGVCAYDRRAFDPATLRRLTWAHPGTAATGAAFDPSVALRIRRTRRPWGLRISGEVDLSNRTALRAAMAALVGRGETEATIDVAGLAFADVAAVRILVHPATTGQLRIRLTGCRPSVRRLLDFQRPRNAAALTVDP